MKKAEPVDVIPSKKIIVGEKNAPITIMQFGDYESVACAEAQEVVKSLLEAYPKEVKFNFRHFPTFTSQSKISKSCRSFISSCAGRKILGNA
jgi:protein-disulfide isomerase